LLICTIKEVEVTKRIPCRIISSVPIGSASTEIQPMSGKNECLYGSDELNAANYWGKQVHRVTDLSAFGICAGILNSMPTGQILDYLA